jgi:hypothetical protein
MKGDVGQQKTNAASLLSPLIVFTPLLKGGDIKEVS